MERIVTQLDPIGLAGGVNLYGFAEGDPVNFRDPMGLCPDDVKKNGVCPGGLTDREFDRSEYAARNHLTTEAGQRVLTLLYAGAIHSGALVPRANATTGFDSHITINTHSRNGNVFESHMALLAYVLAHESKHAEQFSGFAGLVNELRFRFGGQGFRNRIEDQAYAYGCANSTSLLIKGSQSCRQ